MNAFVVDFEQAVEKLVVDAGRLDLRGACDAGLRSLTVSMRAAQRCLDGVGLKIAVQAKHLAGRGESDGAVAVLGSQGKVCGRTARREAARADLADVVPGLGDAMAAGRVSGEHADVLARRIARLSDEERARVDLETLSARAAELPVDAFDRVVKRAVDAAKEDDGLSDTIAKQAASDFRHWFDPDTGMGCYAGSFDPERYEAFTNAIEAQLARLANQANNDGDAGGEAHPVAKNANLAAQALYELVCGSAGRPGPSIGFIVDRATAERGYHADTTAETVHGFGLAPESLSRLCCDAVLRRVTLDEHGVPINVGRRYRTATDAQWAAIKALHATCAWSGCDRPISWCQLHHIHEWEHGGTTDLCNLIPLCSHHHHKVHEGGWAVKLLPDRTLEIHRPDGHHHATVPAPTRNHPKRE